MLDKDSAIRWPPEPAGASCMLGKAANVIRYGTLDPQASHDQGGAHLHVSYNNSISPAVELASQDLESERHWVPLACSSIGKCSNSVDA